ncbi:PAS domain-containing protein [Sphingomicrobium arenosum]|uniref:PAS domain-containing protein n=1 Tax=Sphingomicrobium arenosum TaxID=2233861 RepID=UPI002240F09A|nr:PAS domain-containing protein [Sphingomicrobium arenosum]
MDTRADRRLQQMFDQLVSFVAVLDLDGRMIESGRPALDLAGVDFKDVEGTIFWESQWWNYDPAIARELEEDVARAREGKATTRQTAARFGDQGIIHVIRKTAPIYDTLGNVVEIIVSGTDITVQKQQEAALEREARRQAMLNRELRTRVRDLFVVVQESLETSAEQSHDKAALLDNARERIGALANAHIIGLDHDGEFTVDLRRLIEAVVGVHLPSPASFSCDGPPVRLANGIVTPLTLIVHELARWAHDHGAWRTRDGRVHLDWAVDQGSGPEGCDTLCLNWEEEAVDAPPVEESEAMIRCIARQLAKVEGEQARDLIEGGRRIRIRLPLR